MEYPAYSIRDNKVGFGAPFLEANDHTAIRSFGLKVNANDLMYYSPADYDLYSVGSFDTETAMFKSAVPVLIKSGTSMVGDKK